MCQHYPIDKITAPSMYDMDGISTVPVIPKDNTEAGKSLLNLFRFPVAVAQHVSSAVRLFGLFQGSAVPPVALLSTRPSLSVRNLVEGTPFHC